MSNQQQLIQSQQHLKLTIPRMNKLGIPITPENFSVWYEYSIGTKLELNREIDDILNNGAKFDEEINKKLYVEYIADHSRQQITRTHDSVKGVIEELLTKLDAMEDGLNQFGKILGRCEKVLKDDPDFEDVSSIVTELLTEVDQVKESSVTLEESLETLNEEVEVLHGELEKLEVEVSIDPLTQIANRRGFERLLDQTLQFHQSSGKPLSLLMIDIDFFKKFNDKHGHLVGDRVLTYVAKYIQKNIKGTDTVARLGGEEFVLLLPYTDYKSGLIVADKICQGVASKKLVIGTDNKKNLGTITVSIGVAELCDKDSCTTLIGRADVALYIAKDSGRNCVKGEGSI